jgi:uncharacterized membrane protein HdeD (DUF308 family)
MAFGLLLMTLGVYQWFNPTLYPVLFSYAVGIILVLMGLLCLYGRDAAWVCSDCGWWFRRAD